MKNKEFGVQGEVHGIQTSNGPYREKKNEDFGVQGLMGYRLQADRGPFGPAGTQEMKKIRSLGSRGRFMVYRLQTDHGPFGPASSQEMGNKEFGVQERLMGYKSQIDQVPFGYADPQ